MKPNSLLARHNRPVALVTGASKGIGRAIAVSLAKADFRVVLSARGRKGLQSVAREIEKAGGTAICVPGDATRAADVRGVITKTIRRYGRLDVLVNNVGGPTTFADFLDLSSEDWHAAFKLNVMSMVYFVRYAIPWLKKSETARIINIASISGVEPGAFNPHYTTTKAATMNLSKYLANKLAGNGILVNTICPGPIYSDSWDSNVLRVAKAERISFTKAKKNIDAAEAAKIPLGRIGTPQDVAELASFLAADKSQWITGSCFHINGGKLRGAS